MVEVLVIPWTTWKWLLAMATWLSWTHITKLQRVISIDKFLQSAIVAKFNWISLGCRFPDSFDSHAWQPAWKVDIKDEICASIAKSTSVHVSCRRRHSVSSSLLLCWTCYIASQESCQYAVCDFCKPQHSSLTLCCVFNSFLLVQSLI